MRAVLEKIKTLFKMENSAPVFEAFSDLTPSPQFPTSDGAAPIAAISYTPDFAKAMGYFRSVIKKEEVSQRAYLLTTEVLALNPGNYTVWHWRRRCMDELGLSVEKELEWLDEVGIENEKCYQYWHHRRLVVEKLGKPYAGEEDFFDEILESDSKNYHAWTYRQWYLAHYGLIAGQLDEASKLIESNILNNSFWTFRYFVVAHMHEESKEPAALIEKEVQYALSQIEKKSTNEAAWAYLRGFLKTQKNENPSLDKRQVLYSEVPEVGCIDCRWRRE